MVEIVVYFPGISVQTQVKAFSILIFKAGTQALSILEDLEQLPMLIPLI